MITTRPVQPPALGRQADGKKIEPPDARSGQLVALTCRVCRHRFYLTATPLIRLPRHRRGDNPAYRCTASGTLVKGRMPVEQEENLAQAAA